MAALRVVSPLNPQVKAIRIPLTMLPHLRLLRVNFWHTACYPKQVLYVLFIQQLSLPLQESP